MPINAGASHVVVFRYDGTNIYITVDNGVESNGTAVGDIANISGDWWMGKNGDSAAFHGSIGEVVFYDSALTGTPLSDLNQYFADKWLN